MILELKLFLKKFFFFNELFFYSRFIYLFLTSILNCKLYYNYKKKLHYQDYNQAYFYLNKLLYSRDICYQDFLSYLSLSMRLRKNEKLQIIQKKIFRYKKWNAITHIFILNNFDFKILKNWLLFCEVDLIDIFLNLKKNSRELQILNNFIKKKNLNIVKEVHFKILNLIKEMFFNDMQSNELFYLSVIESEISNYLTNQNEKLRKLKKKCAILHLDPWTQSYGHFYYLDSFIKGVLLGELDCDYIVFSSKSKSVVANNYLFNIYKNFVENKFNINKNESISYFIPNMNAWKKKNGKYYLAHNLSFFIQNKWAQKKLKPIINFNKKDIQEGEKFLSKITQKKWFVTLNVREAGFRYRDHCWLDTGRNSNIASYKKSINYVSKKGGFVLRLGEKRKNKIKWENFYDYGSSEYKSEFLDIYLIYRAKFNIGTCSGPSYLPLIFGKEKNILTNINMPYFIFGKGSIGLPKFFFSIKDKKKLSYLEIEKINPPCLFSGNQNLKNIGIKLVDNNSEDILNATKELLKNFSNPNWILNLKKRKTFLTKTSKNIFCHNKIPLPLNFIQKYKYLL